MTVAGYRQQYDGEWFAPKRTGWRMRCCGCGLVHIVNFRVVQGQVQMQTRQDRRATAAFRRRRHLQMG